MKFLPICIFLCLTTVLRAQQDLNIHPDLLRYLNPALAPFYHGVASGDPTENSVILWTKVTLPKSTRKASVQWELSGDTNFRKVLKTGTLETSSADDFIVKPDVTGLSANTTYYYRFHCNGATSVTGITKTLPSGNPGIDIAFAACSNFEWGYFHNYRFIAEDTTIDLVVHLGDYIYEYGVGGYGDTSLHRWNVPAWEIKTLEDYRTRYSLYRLDGDLMEVHRTKPFITTWDDHESANNAYDEGAQNHQEATEGRWEDREQAARKAYYEWLPVRKKDREPLYRSFAIGSLVNLIILDTRLGGRTVQMEMNDPHFNDSSRTILGKEQHDWFIRNLSSSHTWKIIGNQVPFGPLYLPDSVRGEKYMDGWDGYPYEQKQIQEALRKTENAVLVTGDYHQSFALGNHPEALEDPSGNVAVEFIVTSITSANTNEYVSDDMAAKENDTYLRFNPHVKYSNNTDHGYLVLRVRAQKLTAEFVYATSIVSPEAQPRVERSFIVRRGSKECE